MELVAYSWLAASACAPLVAVLSLWTVYIFHTYRRRWRTVDLFLLAVGTQELVTALFAFGFSILSLVSPRAGPPCSFILWGLTATRTFQIATLASLVVDRALTVRWPYKYRFSVRRNQIRYHIAVLAVIAVFVGVAAVFARSPEKNQQYDCSVHPLEWDRRFSIFNICLHGVLMVTVLVCCFDVELHRCRARRRRMPFSVPSPGTDCATGTASSGSVTSSSSGSTRPLHGPGRQESHRPYSPERPSSDFRWTAVAVVSSLCYLTNHLPYLALNILGIALPSFWSKWHENVILWLRLAEGLLVPLLFYLTDSPHRSALRRAFQRRSGKFSDFGDDSRYRIYLEDALEVQMKPSPFGSVTPVGIITNYRRKEKHEQTQSQKKNCWKAEPKKSVFPSIYGIDTVLNPSHFKNSKLQMVVQTKPQPEKDDTCSMTKHGSSQMSMGTWRDDETHIYATLSDNFSCLSYQSSLPDGSVFGFSCAEPEEETYGGSFTTIANDDFEFHDTRPRVAEMLMRANNANVKMESASEFSGSEFEEEIYRSPESEIRPSEIDTSSESVKDLVIQIDSPSDSCPIKDDSEFENVIHKTRHQSADDIPFHVYRVRTEELCKNALPRFRNTWFSMNDIDRIDYKNDSTDCESEVATLVTPGRSESMLSLEKVSKPCVSTPVKSVSESNLFWERKLEELHPKRSLQEEHFSSEGKLLEAVWKNKRSSLVFGRGSHVRKVKKRKTKTKRNLGRKRSSRKSLEELGIDLNGMHLSDIDDRSVPVLNEEYMRPVDALYNSSSEEDNVRNCVLSSQKGDILKSSLKTAFI
ncbi:uncharacterized protein LOC143223098 [Tachypleus tridentatus]|uniref:uncharacterized protein LOC143223098 n=1 Tax=Tachypleus tridentatus TaxID=6853 RepID=UPI003FD60148